MAVNTNSTADKLRNKAGSGNNNGSAAANSNPKNLSLVESGDTISKLIQRYEGEIKNALPEHIKPERMVRIALTAVQRNPKLKECDQLSFIGALLQAAQLGLEPNTNLGEAFLIPRWNDSAKKILCEFQLGYQGVLTLAHNTKQYSSIYAEARYDGEDFEHKLGLHKDLIHIPNDDLQVGRPTHYYAVYKLINGGYDFKVWSFKKLVAHAEKFSESVKKGKGSPWKYNFDSMAKKTVLLDLLKYAPKSAEMSRMISNDGTVRESLDKEPEKVIIEMENSDPFNNPPGNEQQQGSAGNQWFE